jgi:aspartyl-tRNA(Asn)/glutamyl-tRNA(Gln) amidotransferase subunit C
MSLTLTEVEHIAQLARLELSAEEKERFREQLSAILDYAARLQQVDTHDIPPTSTVLAAECYLRPDEPSESLGVDEVLRNAPQNEARQFRVPPVME